MSVLSTVLVVAALSGFGWKLYQLVRAPRSLPLRVVTAFLGLLLITVLSTVYPRASAAVLGAGSAVLIQNLSALLFSFLMIGFFIGSDAGVTRRRRSREILVELAVMGAVAAIMIAALLAVPGVERDEVRYGGDMTRLPAAVFFAAGNAYLSYAGIRSLVRGLRFARRTDPRTARGLRITAAAQAVGAAVGIGRLVSVLFRATGQPFPSVVDTVLVRVLLVSLVVFFIGLSLPGLTTRWRAIRRRRVHRRMYPRLATLWELLAETFPEGTLGRSQMGGSWWSFRSIDLRCYRRAVECRDGLVRVSPFLARRGVADGTTDIDAVAAALPSALADYRAGPTIAAAAIQVLPSPSGRLDDDILILAGLSHALSNAASDRL